MPTCAPRPSASPPTNCCSDRSSGTWSCALPKTRFHPLKKKKRDPRLESATERTSPLDDGADADDLTGSRERFDCVSRLDLAVAQSRARLDAGPREDAREDACEDDDDEDEGARRELQLFVAPRVEDENKCASPREFFFFRSGSRRVSEELERMRHHREWSRERLRRPRRFGTITSLFWGETTLGHTLYRHTARSRSASRTSRSCRLCPPKSRVSLFSRKKSRRRTRP